MSITAWTVIVVVPVVALVIVIKVVILASLMKRERIHSTHQRSDNTYDDDEVDDAGPR